MTRVLISVDHKMLHLLPRKLLREGDALVVSAAGYSRDVLKQTVADARAHIKETPAKLVYLSCSPRRRQELAVLPVDKYLVDWEPSTVTPWPPTFDEQIEEMKRRMGSKDGLLVSGVPLVKTSDWDYAALAELHSPCIVQTQGFVYRSPFTRLADKVKGNTQFELACQRLYEQNGGSAIKLEYSGIQVAFGEARAAVSPATAAAATRTAAGYGLTQVFVFGKKASAIANYLQKIGRSPQ